MSRRYYSTGEVAKCFEVSTSVVRSWIDRGLLRGGKLPGGQQRRVHRDDLIAFAEAHGLRLDLDTPEGPAHADTEPGTAP